MYSKELFKFSEILDANTTKDNLCEGMKVNERRAIAGMVVDRSEKDKRTMDKWKDRIGEGMKFIRLDKEPKFKPFTNESANIQHPLLLQAVLATSSRLYAQMNKQQHPATFKIEGDDPGQKKQISANFVKHYINTLLEDYGEHTWEDEAQKLYTQFVIMGTIIKQVHYDKHHKCFHNSIIPYTDIYIHNKAKSLSKAPAITKCVYLSKNDVKERISNKIYSNYITDTLATSNTSSGSSSSPYEDGEEPLYDKQYKMLEQHMWMDLDGDGYDEPYIAVVDEDNGDLVRLVPRIDIELSDIEPMGDGDAKPHRLVAEEYFVNYTYMLDPEGNFWGMGLAHMLTPLNQDINEMSNTLANVAYLATQQGGMVGLGGRGVAGRKRIDMTKWDTVPGAPDDIRKSLVNYDIKDPSPVSRELLASWISTGKELGSINEAISGNMPNRDLPAQTLFMLIDESMKNSEAIYRRVRNASTKELKLCLKQLAKDGDASHYKKIVNNPQADFKKDFALVGNGICITSDTSIASASEQLVKLQAVNQFLKDINASAYLNMKEYISRLFNAVDIQDTKGLLQDPPPPPPDPTIQVEQMKLAAQSSKANQHYDIEQKRVNIEAQAVAATADMNRAIATKQLADVQQQAIEAELKIYDTQVNAQIDAMTKQGGGE